MNSFGQIYRLTSFGESHGPAIGGVIDGVPAGIRIDIDRLNHQLSRRRPGQSAITTSRSESDSVTLLSGIFNGLTTGTPIGFTIPNTDTRSADYSPMAQCFRPSHADYTYSIKYGIRDHRGGGRASARETATRIVAGDIAAQALQSMGITITAFTSQVGTISLPSGFQLPANAQIDENIVRCPDTETAAKMISLIERVKASGDTIGGCISCIVRGCPPGLGDPVFGKLQSRLAAAMMSINAAKGFEYGMGFDGAARLGSEMIDNFFSSSSGHISTRTNHSGGIQGGISNGADITMRIAFKPVATLLRPVDTVDIHGNPVTLNARGRHDPCVVPRAVPIVEAMAAMVIFDSLLINRTARL